MLIHVHRGLGYGYPESTLRAFRASLEAGHGIELDPRRTSDGELVVIHDADLKRTRGLPDKVGELSLAELRAEPIKGSQEVIPTLVQVFDLLTEFPEMPDDAVALHLKVEEQTPETIADIGRLIQETGMTKKTFVFDLSQKSVEMFRALDGEIRIGVSAGDNHYHAEFFPIAQALAADIDVIWADENRSFYSAELISACHATGKKVYCISPDLAKPVGHPRGKSGYEHTWRDLVAWGADSICTDLPRELETVLHERKLATSIVGNSL